MQICSNCGEENPRRFRLCGFCGTALAAGRPGRRRSARRSRSSSPISKARLTSASASIRSRCGGHEPLLRGHACRARAMAARSRSSSGRDHGGLRPPTLHEDDALRAVRAAAGHETALLRLNDDSIARGASSWRTAPACTGRDRGRRPGRATARHGDPVNTAARLEQAAPANEILIGELTYRLVRESVEVEQVARSSSRASWSGAGLSADRGRDEACGGVTPPRSRRARWSAGTRRSSAPRGLRPPSKTAACERHDRRRRRRREVAADPRVPRVGGRGGLVVRGRCLPYGRGSRSGPWSRSSDRPRRSTTTTRPSAPGPSYAAWSATRTSPSGWRP